MFSKSLTNFVKILFCKKANKIKFFFTFEKNVVKTKAMGKNLLESILSKKSNQFTKEDFLNYYLDNGFQMVNFHYIGGDLRIKTLTFYIDTPEYLDSILTYGERIDGSSVFKNIDAGSSDLYLLPVFKTAYIEPFEEIPTIGFFCRIFEADGSPFKSSFVNVLIKAKELLKEKTNYDFKALGELEYYIISDEKPLYPTQDQKGYHATEPFALGSEFRKEAMKIITNIGGTIKYGHTEVGTFIDDDKYYEQHEIEFLPTEPEEAAYNLLKAKWVLRNLTRKVEKYNNLTVTFAPKITEGRAGSGLHFHFLLEKNGKNVMLNENGELSDVAKKMIAGILDIAKPLSAFGNMVPISYLRLVPHQEAPTNICWGDRNRSVLIRVPLGWNVNINEMHKLAKNNIENTIIPAANKQTVEIRSADNSANIFLFLAGIIIGAYKGITSDKSLEKAKKYYAPVNIFKEKGYSFEHLPASCYEAAEELEKHKNIFIDTGIFTENIINSTIKRLKSYNDKNLSEELYGNKEKIKELVNQYLHCG